MKHTLRSIATALTLVLMFTVFATSVFVASTSVTEVSYAEFRGNGTYSARNDEDLQIAIGKKETVKLAVKLVVTVDPNTASHKITSKVALRQIQWYGYSTLLTVTPLDGMALSNTSASFCTYSISTSGSATTTSTGDYYIYASTSGASSAFYNNYKFTTTYTVGN